MLRLKIVRWGSALVIAVVGIIVFAPTFQAGFWTDDFVFVALAAQRGLGDYLSFYFDPRNLELQWYRPIQGLQWWIEYQAFGTDPTGYHLINVIFHLIDCWLIYVLVARLTRDRASGLISALAFLGLPLVAWDVFWPGDADPLLGTFYIAALTLWIFFRQEGRAWMRWGALLAFIGALLT